MHAGGVMQHGTQLSAFISYSSVQCALSLKLGFRVCFVQHVSYDIVYFSSRLLLIVDLSVCLSVLFDLYHSDLLMITMFYHINDRSHILMVYSYI